MSLTVMDGYGHEDDALKSGKKNARARFFINYIGNLD